MKFKHFLSLSAFAAMSVCAMAKPDGAGTPDDPYQIKTVDDWNYFANRVCIEIPILGGYMAGPQPNACAVLCNDIDMSESDFKGIGALGVRQGKLGREYNCPYTGTFDGQNHIISNVVMLDPHLENRQGVFVNLGDTAVVKNLFVKDVVAALVSYDGAFCSYSAGTIEDCYITGVVYDASAYVSDHLGDMVSAADGTNGLGGFLGLGDKGSTVTNCVCGVTFEYDAEFDGTQFQSGNEVGLFAGSCAKASKCICVAGSKGEPVTYIKDYTSSLPLIPSWMKKVDVSTVATVADAEAIIAERTGIDLSPTPVAGVMADKFMGADDRCTVYSINGSVVYSGAASGMKVAKPGIYVVKIGGATRKMYVK